MPMLRVMVIAATLGTVLVSGCSCSSSACNPANCSGCCDSAGLCHIGSLDNACGSGANSCQVCSGTQTCGGSSCTGGMTSGDGGVVSTTDGGVIIGGTTVSGRVTYDAVPSTFTPGSTTGTLNFAKPVAKPVRNAVIQVIQGTAVIGTAVTDADGAYTVTYKPNGTAEVRVYALARTMTPPIQVQDNTDNRATYAVYVPVGMVKTGLNLHANHGWTGTAFDENARNASPFAVLDTMLTATQAFLAVRPAAVFPPLKVNWSSQNAPQAGDVKLGQISTSHYSPSENEIYVLGKAGADIDEFDNHVIAHEWGHFFEANLSRSDSPGGRHGPGDILDPRIAFGEAWGNALSAMVLKDPVYFDCLWGMAGIKCFGWDSETEPQPTDDPTPSAFSESSLLRVLYDLYDPASAAEPFDKVSLGLGPIYDAMVGGEKSTDAVTTIASFITALKAQPNVTAADIDSLLAERNIGVIRNEFGRDDTNLTDIFTSALTLPFNGGIMLGGGNLPNTWQQNQYYVFVGTGGMITCDANSAEDVAITVYQRGKAVGTSDKTQSGHETVTIPTTTNAAYVLVLTGYGQTNQDYDVAITIQ